MNKAYNIFSILQRCTAVCMILALLWLTISAPFVYSAQLKLAEKQKLSQSHNKQCEEEEPGNPLNNSTEEKTSSVNSFSEEYLHHSFPDHHIFKPFLQHHKGEDADTYTAFHGELLVPPPNRA